MTGRIEGRWKLFKQKLLRPDTPAEQRELQEVAFYSGYSAAMHAFLEEFPMIEDEKTLTAVVIKLKTEMVEWEVELGKRAARKVQEAPRIIHNLPPDTKPIPGKLPAQIRFDPGLILIKTEGEKDGPE